MGGVPRVREVSSLHGEEDDPERKKTKKLRIVEIDLAISENSTGFE